MCKLGVEIGEAYVKLQLTRKLCMPQRTWDPNTAVYARPTLPDVPLVGLALSSDFIPFM